MRSYPLRAWAVVAALAPPIFGVALWEGGEFPGLTGLLLWLALLALSELLPITLGLGSEVTMSVPIHLAMAMIFPPWVAILTTGLAALDIREFRREISLEKALYNRFQIMLAVGAAAAVFVVYPGQDFSIIPIALAASSLLAVNLGLVAIGVAADEGVPLRVVIKDLLPSPMSGFLLSYAALIALGAASAVAYQDVAHWAAVAILIPLMFARLSFLGAKAQQELSEKVQKQQQALLEATQQVFEEREAERHRIAEHIHDSSLQLLAAAAYGAENTIALMDKDLEEAKKTLATARGAVDQAIQTLRNSLVDLRRSSVEEGGLMQTVKNYTDQVRTLWGIKVELKGRLSNEPPVATSLAALQILQEALINAVKHSKSEGIFVMIEERIDGMVHVVVEDQGQGFDTSSEAGVDHVGMRLMSERAKKLGGHLDVTSQPGKGTRIEATLPGGVAA